MENLANSKKDDLNYDSKGKPREITTLLDGTIAKLSKEEAMEANAAIRESLGN